MTAPLSFPMKLALRDLADTGPEGEDIGRFDKRSLNALASRGLVNLYKYRVRLTGLGRDVAQALRETS